MGSRDWPSLLLGAPPPTNGSSLATQEQLAREYCAEHGSPVEVVYREGFTGEELWMRPQLTKLRDATRAHAFGVVVMHATETGTHTVCKLPSTLAR
jgi:hypothetical protein